MNTMYQRIGVIGAGAWGTALALSAARAGRDTLLWGRNADAMAAMQSARMNSAHLEGVSFPGNLHASAAPMRLSDCDLLLAAVPAQMLNACLADLKPHLPPVPVLICAKGIEQKSGQFLSDHLAQILSAQPIGMLSGPGFAKDVAQGLPTAVSLAFANVKIAATAAASLSSQTLRLYSATDVRGVEIGGALKNIFAIAAGVVAGGGFGESARAALIARSFAEMQRFGIAHGAKLETFSGLSGLGDLVLTATSPQSRNFRFGLALGTGESVNEAQKKLGTVEGISTASAALAQSALKNIEMPVTQAVVNILSGTESIDAAAMRLLRRPLKSEA